MSDAVAILGVLGVGLLPWDTPVLFADDEGVTRGDGCFEGIRVIAGSAAKLDRHLDRMGRSATALGLPFDPAPWRALVAEACAAWPSSVEGALKLMLTRGRSGTPTGVLTLVPASAAFPAQRRDGISVITLGRGSASDAFAGAPWLLGGVKTLSYAVNMAAYRHAARSGADDVIFVSSDGFTLEAPTSSVVWWDGAGLSTVPAGSNGILAGTTQDLLFERVSAAGWRTSCAPLPAQSLASVEALWLVSSVRGPVEVAVLDGAPRETRPDLTREIQHLAGF